MQVRRWVALMLIAALLLSACAHAKSEITIHDGIGREITLTPGSYERVVCIGAGALRMFSYIGDLNLLCGVEDIDNTCLDNRPSMFDSVARPYLIANEALLQTLPSCGVGGPNAQVAEAEKILSCNPDIVISAYEDATKADALQQQLGVPVVSLRSGKDGVFDEAFSVSMRLLGVIFAREERAEELLSFIDRERSEIESRTSGIADEDRPAAYICGLGNWGTTNHLSTSEHYIAFDIAKVQNAVHGLRAPGVQTIEEEMFIALGEKMDKMIIDAAAIKNILPLYAQDEGMFDFCKAWQDGEVYLQMAYNAYYTNFEIALANAWFIAKSIYPERFSDVDMKDKLGEITSCFLGQDLADAVFAYPTSFGGYQRLTPSFFS